MKWRQALLCNNNLAAVCRASDLASCHQGGADHKDPGTIACATLLEAIAGAIFIDPDDYCCWKLLRKSYD
jgi:hypothetical protein